MIPGRARSAEVPAPLKAIAGDLLKSEDDARRIAGSLSDAQINWQPRSDAWSIAQCLDHLARANTVYAAAISQALAQYPTSDQPWPGPIQPGWVARVFIRSLEPPPKRKIRAPKKIVPASRIGGREVLAAFLRSHEDVRAVIAECARRDLNRIRFRNPFFGFLRFSAGAGLLILSAHDRRHLWQAERVRECPGFPTSAQDAAASSSQ